MAVVDPAAADADAPGIAAAHDDPVAERIEISRAGVAVRIRVDTRLLIHLHSKLSLDDDQRAQAGDFFRDTGFVDYVHDLIDIFIRERRLFGQTVARTGVYDDAL